MYVKSLLNKITHISSVLVPIFMLLSTSIAVSASVSLSWDPNNPTPDGYRVFARKSGQAYNYSQPAWEGSSVTCTVDSLQDQTDYYFVVRAYEGSMESVDSEEVHYIPAEPANPLPVTDQDGDGMPDEWETHFGLDPTVDDAGDDLDQDGISNIDEYQSGLEPDDPGTGTAPLQPEPLFPPAYSRVESNPQLEVGDYSDVDGDAHISTQWQIFDTGSGDCLLDVISDRRLARLTVPLLLLNGDREYHWRVRFFDSGGRVSDWSATLHFTTEKAANDLDGNGISDEQEGDGTTAGDVYALSPPAATFDPTGIAVGSGDTVADIEQMIVVDPAGFETDDTTPSTLPSRMVAYKLTLHEPGQRAQVTVHLSNPAPYGATWVKYDAVNGWQDYSDHAVISADRRSVTVEVEDGGYGDADGVANGIIIDPSGLSTENTDSPAPAAPAAAAEGGGGGGGGCFINTAQGAGPAPLQWLKTKMAGLLAILGR